MTQGESHQAGRRVTTTLLFSDLVGSTAMATRLGPDAADALRRTHDRLLRGAMAEAGGVEIKHTGDGFMVAYDSLRGGLDGAAAMQRSIQRHNARSDERLAIRVGLSLGDVVQEDGDYFGRPAIEAARLCNAAEGDEVLVLDVVRVLAADGEFEFTPSGEIDLKGLGPVTVHRLAWEEHLASATTIAPPGFLSRVPVVAMAGRKAELAALRDDLGAVMAGEPRWALLSGEPGIGKTRLAGEVARSAADRGASVLFGRSAEEVSPPFQPWVEAIRHALQRATPELRDEILTAHGAELARVVAELRDSSTVHAPGNVGGDGAPDGGSSDPETLRYRLFAAISGTLALLAEHDPVVVILDDLHWADAPSLGLLGHAAQSLREHPVFVIGTYRDTDVGPTHPVNEMVASLSRVPGCRTIALEGLDPGDVGVLATTLLADDPLGREHHDLVHAVVAGTDGNPFFATELLTHVAESGHLASELPSTVRHVVLGRVDRLGADTRALLTAAAVLGQRFDVSLLAATVGRDEEAVLDQLEAASDIQLVQDLGDDVFAFSHALVGEVLLGEMGSSRVQRLHRAAADQLAALDDRERLGELARHRLLGHRPGDEEEVIGLLEAAADQASHRLSPGEAARWLAGALDLAPTAGMDPADRCRLIHKRGVAQRDSGDPGFRETLLEVTDLADQLGDDDVLVASVLDNGRGMTSAAGVTDVDRIDALKRALEAVGPEPGAARSRLLAMLGSELVWAQDYDERKALTDEALAMARGLDDPDTLLFVLNLRHDTIQVPFELDERLANTEEAVALAELTEDLTSAFFAAETRIRTVASVADLAEIERQLDREDDIAARLGLPILRWFATFQRSWFVLAGGNATEGERLIDQAFQIGLDAGQPDVMEIYASTLINLRLHQGRMGELQDLVADTALANPGIPGFRAVLGFIHAELDDPDKAMAVIAPDIEAGFDTFAWDVVWQAGMALCSEIVAAAGDADAATVLIDKQRPFADLTVYTGPSVWGSTRRFLGLLEQTRGRFDEAEKHFRAAHEQHRAWSWPYWAARTELNWAALLAEVPGRRSEAELLARSAVSAGQSLGNDWLIRRAELVLATVAGDHGGTTEGRG